MTWVFNATEEQEHASNYPAIVSLCVVTTVLATAVTFARVQRRRANFGGDEIWSILSLIFSIIYNGFTLGQTRWGLALPPANRPEMNAHNYSIVNFWSRPFYLAGIACFKIALCIGSLRLTDNSDLHTFRRAVKIGAWASGIIQVIFIGLELGNCSPWKKNFHNDIPGYCMPFGPVNWTISIVTVLNDCFVFLNPVWLVRRLQLRRAQKIRLYIGFLLGFITTIFSVLRMAYIPNIVSGNGDSTMLVFYGNIEMNMGTISASLIFLMRPIVDWMSRLKDSSVISKAHISSHGGGDFKLDSFNPESRYTARNTTVRRTTQKDDDDDTGSQENILVIQKDEKYDGIFRSTRVTVYSENGVDAPSPMTAPPTRPRNMS